MSTPQACRLTAITLLDGLEPPTAPDARDRGCRRAVRAALPASGLVLVALSGGPDSLALAAATAFEAPRAGIRAGAVVVDHGLQPGSADVAARAAEQARSLGLDPVLVRVVPSMGPAARKRRPGTARYAALDEAASETGAVLVLLGHTLDDQAETVLLGLARGSGPTSLHGDGPGRGPIRPAASRRPAVDPLASSVRSPASSRGSTRRTPTGRSRACECARPCCPCSSGNWDPGSPRRWPEPPTSCVRTATRSTTSPEEQTEELAELAESGISLRFVRSRQPAGASPTPDPARGRERVSSLPESRADPRGRHG